MALWDLMTALCFVSPSYRGRTSNRERYTKKAGSGYALAILVGVVVGAFCAWAMRAVGSKVAGDSKPGAEAQKPWLFRMLYAATVIWIVFALFLGKLADESLPPLHLIEAGTVCTMGFTASVFVLAPNSGCDEN